MQHPVIRKRSIKASASLPPESETMQPDSLIDKPLGFPRFTKTGGPDLATQTTNQCGENTAASRDVVVCPLGLRGIHEKTRINHAAQRCGGVAAGGTSAAAVKASTVDCPSWRLSWFA